MTASSASRSSASDPILAPGEVHLWLCHLGAARELDRSVLSTGERARSDERQLGRLFTRHLLSRYAGESPADLRFANGRHGKPALLDPSHPLEFNLSHSGPWLAMAVSLGTAVGVDVQVIDRDRAVERLARRYFPAAEREDLDALSGESYRRHFYRLWSLKEAWTKAAGGALPTALGEVGFRIDGRELVSLAAGRTAGSSIWLLQMAGFSLAVCALGERLSLSSRRFDEGPLDLPLVAALGVP